MKYERLGEIHRHDLCLSNVSQYICPLHWHTIDPPTRILVPEDLKCSNKRP